MELQAASATTSEKPGLLGKLTVAICLLLTAGLLISSLVSPGRADGKAGRASAISTAQL